MSRFDPHSSFAREDLGAPHQRRGLPALELDGELDQGIDLERYASLFNTHDWDGVLALVADDCRLDLVAKSQRRGKDVRPYFGNYTKLDVRLRVVRLEGQLALAAHLGDTETPAYFILLAFEDGKVTAIRDYRYVPYIALEADITPA